LLGSCNSFLFGILETAEIGMPLQRSHSKEDWGPALDFGQNRSSDLNFFDQDQHATCPMLRADPILLKKTEGRLLTAYRFQGTVIPFT